jgi:hypothetical protein
MAKITRIRYKKDPKNPHILVSKDIVATTGSRYRVFLDTEKKTYKIKNLISENCYYGGDNITNLNHLKASVKRRLERNFKVEFGSELRNRTFGLCERGYTQDKHEQEHE